MIAGGSSVFSALAWLAENLAEQGEPPVVLPGKYDPRFWEAVTAASEGNPSAFASYPSLDLSEVRNL